MKFNITMIALGAICLAAVGSFAKDSAKPLQATLSDVPAAELPAKALELVSAAKASHRKPETVEVVKAAVAINPAAAPAIVGAIARALPEMAPIAAATAAAEQPKQAGAIAKAAAAAAPKMAYRIVLMVCQAVPREYRAVAIAVAEAVPGSEKDVLAAVEAALPDLKYSIQRALASSGGGISTVAATLDQAASLPKSQPSSETSTTIGGTPMPRGPAIGPPFVPLGSTPGDVTSGSSGNVPPGGRDYAQP